MNPWDWSEHTLRVLTALGTTGAVIALVVVEMTKGLRRAWTERRRRPLLTLAHDPLVDLTFEVGRHPQNPDEGDRSMKYVRLAVRNAPGRRAAEAVEVVVVRVDLVAGPEDGRFPIYNLGPLTWSHRDPLGNRIGPGASSTVAGLRLRRRQPRMDWSRRAMAAFPRQRLRSWRLSIHTARRRGECRRRGVGRHAVA